MLLNGKDVQEWYLELQAIDQHLKDSAEAILTSCEDLMLLQGDSETIKEIVNSIVENCNFHDLNSQRLRKIIHKLEGSPPHDFDVTNVPKSAKKKSHILENGPQRLGNGLSQSDVEHILKSTL
jgi:hypothetical protein